MPSLAHTQRLIQSCHLSGTAGQTGYVADFFMDVLSIEAAANAMLDAGFFLENITAIDLEEGFQLAYHFDHAHRPGRVCLRIIIPHDPALAPSISSIFRGANWHERECMDFYGIRFNGHPNPLPLLLSPDHPGEPPLLKTPSSRKSLYHLFPGRTFEHIDPLDDLFRAAIAAPATATTGERV